VLTRGREAAPTATSGTFRLANGSKARSLPGALGSLVMATRPIADVRTGDPYGGAITASPFLKMFAKCRGSLGMALVLAKLHPCAVCGCNEVIERRRLQKTLVEASLHRHAGCLGP
jgi:hypothetical protein